MAFPGAFTLTPGSSSSWNDKEVKAMKASLVTLFVGGLLLLAAAGAWPAVTGTISGRVTDGSTGAPLPGVNVVLVGAGLTTVTDRGGHFSITNIPPGSYPLSFSLVGYREDRVTEVTVTQGQTTSIELALAKAVIEAKGAEARVTAARGSPPAGQPG